MYEFHANLSGTALTYTEKFWPLGNILSPADSSYSKLE